MWVLNWCVIVRPQNKNNDINRIGSASKRGDEKFNVQVTNEGIQ